MADKAAKDAKEPKAKDETVVPSVPPSEPDTLSGIARQRASLASQLKPPVRDPKSGIRVRAKERGFYNGARRKAGSTFIIPAGEKPAKWMEVVGKTD